MSTRQEERVRPLSAVSCVVEEKRRRYTMKTKRRSKKGAVP